MAQDKLNTAASTETWGENDKPAPASGSTDWGAGDKEFHPEAPSRGFKGWARDVAATAVKGAIGVPEAIVGLADIPTGGRVGKFLENEGGSVGFRPKEAKELVNDWHSDATKEAQRKFQQAEGIGGKFMAAVENPSNIVTAVGESLPSMGLGGVAARGLMTATKLGQMGAKGAALAGAAGEGVTMAGSAAEQIRQETPDGLLTPGQSALAGATGLVGGALGAVGGRVAQKLGIGDVDTMIAQGGKGMADEAGAAAARAASNPLVQQQAMKGIPRRVIEGAISEGFLEELPQSVAEQVFHNVALGKDWLQDVDAAAVMGVLSGGLMGGAASGYHGMRQPAAGADTAALAADQGQPDPQSTGDVPAMPNPGMESVRQAFADKLAELQMQEQGEQLGPQTTPPDGAAVLAQQQAEEAARRQAAQEASRSVASPDDEIYQSTGATVPPSVHMGLDPAAGPLSAGAAIAVDTGVSGQMQQAAALAKASEQAAKNGKKQANPTQKQEQTTQALQGVDPETGELSQAVPMNSWTDADLSSAFRGAQSRDVRMQLAQELSRRRAEREQQALQAELDAEQAGTVPGAERADAAFASLSEDAGPVPADLSIPTTIKGNTDVPQADQAQQAAAQPAQAGPAQPAQGLTDAAPAEYPGAQGTPATGAQAAPETETREQRTKRVSEAGESWTRMPTVERQALAQRADLKPIVQKNVHSAAWENLNGDIQRKLADALAWRAEYGQNQAPAPTKQAPVAIKDEAADAKRQKAIQRVAEGRGWFLSQDKANAFVADSGLGDTHEVVQDQKRFVVQEKAAAPAIAPLEPVDSLHNPGKPDPKNSAAMDELGGFKPGDNVDVDGRTIGRSTVELVYRRQMAGLGALPMARVVGADGKKLDVLLSELTRAEQKAGDPAPAAPAQEKPNADGSTIVGRRADGVMIRQDKNGVRFYAEGGVRISETVELRPTRQGMQMAKGELKPEFMTAEEGAATKPAPKDDANTRARNWAERTAMPDERAEVSAKGPYAQWRDSTPAQRREQLRAAGYTDTDQARALSGMEWGQLTDPVRKALSGSLSTASANPVQMQGMNEDKLNPAIAAVREHVAGNIDKAELIDRLRPLGLTEAQVGSVTMKLGDDFTAADIRAVLAPAPSAGAAQAQNQDAGNVQPPASAPASAQKPVAKKPSADQTRARADLMNALADLGDILGKNTRMNIVPEQEQKLLPVLTRVLDAAFRLGYHKFKDSAKFALDQIRTHLGDEAADALTLDHLQGAYIAMAGGKQGADTKRAVIDVESKADIETHEAVTADSETDTMESPAEGAAPTGADDERNNLPSQSPQALGNVAAAEGGQPESSGRTGAGAADGGQGSRQDGGRADGAGVPAARSGGSGAGRVRAAQAGARGKSGAVGTQGTGDAGAPAPAADGRVAVPGGAASAPNIPAADFQITDEVGLGKGGEVQKFNDNLAAIRTLKQIEAENRRATPGEQAALARYVGWGGLASAFPDPISGEFKDKWKARGEELRELLTDAEYKAARRSTRNAHYTSQTIVTGIWDAVRRLGYRGGLVLESSMGSGNFLGLAPADLAHRFVGVEYDSLTSRIAQALYPQATVLHSGFQSVPVPDNAFMLNIGNPPFGSESLRFQFKPELQGVSIHNQFFRAGMDALRPGGLQAMVVSRYLMDAKDKSSRLAMASKAKLIAAIRLPDTAFKENARTDVVTDILIFQKLEPGEQAAMEVAVEEYRKLQAKAKGADAQAAALVPAWVETVEMNDPLGGEPMTVNAHFQQNPNHVLGVLERSGSMQHGADITVRLDNPAELGARLAAVVATLPENVQNIEQEVMDATAARHRTMSDALRIAMAAEETGHVKTTPDGKLQRVIERETPEGDYEFAYQDIDENSPWSESLSQDAEGRWYELVEARDEQGQKVKVLGKDGKPTKRNLYERKVFADVSEISPRKLLGKTGLQRLAGLVKLRDLLKRQLTLETADAAKVVMEGNRKALAAAYAEFIKANGPVNRSANMALAMTMPDGGLVAALEVGYQPERTAAQAASSGLPEQNEVAKPAPILRERVVPKYEPATKASTASDALAITLSERGRVDMERIASLLGVSEEAAAEQLQAGADPLVFKDPESGAWETADVYLSGMVKRKLNAARAAGLAKNVQALEKVIPEDWTAENVQATMGATWVPPDVYAAFMEHLAGGKTKVSFSSLTNSFSLSTGNTDPSKFKLWSSEGAPVDYIVTRILNSKPVTVTGKDADGNTYVDKELTALAGLKAREIVAEFGDWVFKDGDRRQRLVELFNEKFNTRVVRQYNGQHLALPGKVPDSIIKMRRHQLNAIWRGIYERFMLVDHAVGAGKTFTAIARAMERRRMGLSRKPMIVVPNHLVEQWEADVYRLYPGAKVLAAGKNDFEAKRRRRLFGKIATGDWDIVIVPHSSFGFIGISQETESRYLELEMAQAQAAIQEAWDQAKEDGTDNGRRKPFGVKEAERLAEKIQARMDRLKEGVRDRLLTFEQMGVDDLTVDEAHEFKNLYYSSNLTGVRGMGDKTGSRKANDLYNKVRVLTEQPTAAVSFLTGTPISNSAVEMFTMLRYLAAGSLEEMGLTHFDAFRTQFVEATPAFEPTESGRLKQVTRLGRTWSNMRSLMDLYYQVTDAVSLEDIKRFYAEDNQGQSFPVPKVAGDKDRRLIAIKPTPAQEQELKDVMAGFDGLEDIEDPYERNAERLRLMDRARKVSLDVRAVNPRNPSTEEGGKLQRVAQEVKRIYDKWHDDKGTQLVFLDRSVPRSKGDDAIIKGYDALVDKRDAALAEDNQDAYQEAQEALDRFDPNEIAELRQAQASPWSAYQQIKDNLVAMGIPADEIRFVQEASNDEQKAALFDAVNGGKVRVLLGSTPRMGAGTNVQKRAVALHHVDVTWKPSDIEQREGRVVRQGNEILEKHGEGFEVEILAYATERTVDAKMWDLNATKLRTINGIRKYQGAFTMEFDDEEAVGMAEMAALASGNPLLLERVQAESEIQTLEMLERAHRRKMWGVADELDRARRAIERNPGMIETARQRTEDVRKRIGAVDEAAQKRAVTVEGERFADQPDALRAAEAAIKLQQEGNDKARFAITIDGERVSSKDAVAAAIGAALGDVDTFEATVSGKRVLQRTAAAREIAALANEQHHDKDGAKMVPLGSLYGYELVADIDFATVKGDRVKNLRLSLMDGEKTIASDDANEVPSQIQYTATNIRAPLERLVDRVRAMASSTDSEYLTRQLERAKRDLPDLEARAGETFPKAGELAAKRERLKELVQLLDGKAAAQPSPEQESDAGDEENFGAAQAMSAGSAADRAIMDMVREGRTAQDILRFVASASKSRFNRQVARLLLKSGIAPAVRLEQTDLGSGDGFTFLAKYSRKHNALTLTPGAQAQAEHIVMHELMHAATLRALDRKGLASLQMRRLYEHVKRQGGAAGEYGMKNVGEFVAEAFTNPEFQRALRGITAPPGGTLKTAWDGFVRILRSILGLPQDAHDALSQALELGVAVMREDMALRQRGAQQRQAGDAFVQSQQTRSTYEGRIDALFNGGKAQRGTAVLDRSDVMGLLGHPDVPLMLNERHLLDGLATHPEMTAAAWKKVPGWLENPAAVFTDPNHPGRLMVIAPDRIAGYPVLMAVEPNPAPAERGKTDPFQLLVTVFAKTTGDLPALGYLGASGRLLYADTKKAPEVWRRAGGIPQAGRHPGPRAGDIPRTGGPTSGAKKILTEKHLNGWRKANLDADGKGADGGDAYFGAADLGKLKSGALDQLHQTLSHPGKVSLWDKTVGTMRHLGERAPIFKPVYEAAQRFIDDVSMLGNDAADRAPRLLPRVETLADLKKKPITAADNKAVGKPLFEGTLLWARDMDGTPVTTEKLNDKYRNATPDEKAQILLRTGKIQAQMLKVWRGLPVDQFNTIINNKFDSTILKPGVVWSAKELSELFGLNDQQVSLYQEARGAIDRSIDMTARADMLRMMGDGYASMREVVLEQASLQDAMALLTDTLQAEAREIPDQADRLMKINNDVVKSYERAIALQEAGYAPLSRFGRYTVDVVSPDGTREYFGMFESMRDANLMAERMRGEFKGAAVTQGTMSDEAYKLFAGITPESLEQFGEMLGLKTDGDTAQDKAFQAYLQLSKNNHSALKRLIHRKGITGYSEDVGRVLASFVYSNARLAAGGLNAGTLEQAIQAIPKEQGELRDVAMGLRSYIQDPQEEGQAVRGMLFAQYLGGSVASAFVNMTQPFQITMPWLSQYGGMRKAAGQMARALKDMGTKGFKYEPDLEKALQDAVDDGTVSPQEIHQLMAQARGTGSLRAGDGTRMGDARAAVANNWERTKVAWGQPFALAEQFNRRSTFIAAYRTAKEQGMPAPAEFARRAVQETQFVYSKANKMRWGRGAIGGTMMTFKTYSVSYLELMHRMWTQGGPEGKRAVGWAVAMLMLMGGAGGLPFMEDAEDLIDGAGQLMGYNVSTKQWRKQLLRDTIGKELGNFVEQGVSGLPGAPIDVSGRLGMGNLVPGTGLLLSKQNRERDLMEVVGPAGDLVARGFTGARKALTGDLAGAALEVSPTAVRNAAKGLDMATSGIYKDTKGYKVIDTTLDEAIAKAIGFQPRSVAEVQESNSFMQRSKSFYIQTSSDIKAQWAQALFNKDDAALERVRERLADWNRDNPDQPIVVKMPDVWKRVREMGKDRTQRIADTAPKALRGQMREMARENG